MKKYFSIPKSFSDFEKVFFLITLFFSLGFAYKSTIFAKLGIPLNLPQTLGNVSKQEVRLFSFEIYLLLFCGLFVFSLVSKKINIKKFELERLLLLTIFLFVYGMIRLLIEISWNPILGLRNSIFVWYLSLPILLCFLPIQPKLLEFLSRIICTFIFLILLYSVITIYFLPTTRQADWRPEFTCYLLFAFALLIANKKISYPILLTYALAFGTSVWFLIQRTSFLGFCITFLFIFYFYKNLRWQMLKRIGLMAVFILIGAFYLSIKTSYVEGESVKNQLETMRNPIVKTHAEHYGAEPFRRQMWEDAWELFLAYPIFGIGFQSQVVYRVHGWKDIFVPNTGHWFTHEAPISGPHNSYLNAIARMGFFGFGFLILHIWAMWILWQHQYFGMLSLLFAQFIYAMFNIGLETPSGNFFLLLALGTALLLRQEAA